MIKARGLARTFKARGRYVEAVRDVAIDAAEGELVGFLGDGHVAQGGGTAPECRVSEEIAVQRRFYGLSKSHARRSGAEL